MTYNMKKPPLVLLVRDKTKIQGFCPVEPYNQLETRKLDVKVFWLKIR